MFGDVFLIWESITPDLTPHDDQAMQSGIVFEFCLCHAF